MFVLRGAVAPLVVTLSLSLAGCLVPQSRLTRCQSENEALADRCQTQTSELAQLQSHSRKLEDQLVSSEEQLADIQRRYELDEQRLANLESERDQIHQRFGNGRSLPPGLSDRLAALAQRYPSLHYDSVTGISKLDTDVLFETGQAEIDQGGRDVLREFAAVLRAPEANGMKLMVVGHTDSRRITGEMTHQQYPNNWHLSAGRALVVADHLRALGVDDSRMGVAGLGKHQPLVANSDETSRQKNRRVEVFLVAPDVPIVGWTETISSVYR